MIYRNNHKQQVEGVWNQENNIVNIRHPKGRHFQHAGIPNRSDGSFLFQPEEALFLHQWKSLNIVHPDLKRYLRLDELWTYMSYPKGIYLPYAYLKRLGYIIYRHGILQQRYGQTLAQKSLGKPNLSIRTWFDTSLSLLRGVKAVYYFVLRNIRCSNVEHSCFTSLGTRKWLPFLNQSILNFCLIDTKN